MNTKHSIQSLWRQIPHSPVPTLYLRNPRQESDTLVTGYTGLLLLKQTTSKKLDYKHFPLNIINDVVL